MGSQEILFPHHHQVVTNRFVAACQADERVVAAFIGGSYAKGTADAYSDLDLYLITSDAAYEDFLSSREPFIRLLGEPLFLESWGTPHIYSFILADGTEGELGIGRASGMHEIQAGPHAVLLDKTGLLTGVVLPPHQANPAEQVEVLRRQVNEFWHELSHFIKGMGRGQLWFARGSLDVMRGICVNLARLRHDFSDGGVGDEPYFKVDQALPVEQLSPLRATYCPLAYAPMRQAARAIVDFYRELAPPLAVAHGIAYPAELEQILLDLLDALRHDQS